MNQAIQQQTESTAQIRLLLPAEWLAELNAVAKSRFVSRLSLIRYYLRLQLDKDLSELQQHFQQRESNRKTTVLVEKWFNEREE